MKQIESTQQQIQDNNEDWREKLLRRKEEQLRRKEEQLREELAQLRRKEEQLQSSKTAAPNTIAEALARLSPVSGVTPNLPEPSSLSQVPVGWPVLARDDFFDTVFTAITDRLVAKSRTSDRNGNQHIVVQASPGGGKTFALDRISSLSPAFINTARIERYLAKKRDELTADQQEQVRRLFDAQTTISLFVTFNSNTPTEEGETFEENPKMAIIARIVHDYCTRFLGTAGLVLTEVYRVLSSLPLGELEVTKAITAIMQRECQRRGVPKIKLVLLAVDELIKAKNPARIVSLLGTALDSKTIPFAYVVSTLDRLPLRKENESSNRPATWAVLRPLPTDELLASSIFTKWKDIHAVKLVLETCGGWPRYVQWLHEILKDGDVPHDDLSRLVGALLEKLSKQGAIPKVTREILRPAILSESVEDDNWPDPQRRHQTFAHLVAMGVYCNSLSSLETPFIPTIAPLLLLTLTRKISNESYCNAIKFIYHDAFLKAGWQAHEKMVYGFEWLRRAVLKDGESYQTTVRKLFPSTLHNESTETIGVLDTPVELRGGNSTVVYNPVGGWDKLLFKETLNSVVRSPPGTPGFDVYTPLQGQDGSTVLVAIQCRFSLDHVTTKLSAEHLPAIKTNSDATVRDRLGVTDQTKTKTKVVYVVLAYRNRNSSLSAAAVPDNMVVLARQELELYFGPSMWHFYKLFSFEAWQGQ